MLPQTATFYKETKKILFWFNAEFTRAPMIFLTQQLLKSGHFLRESGNIVVSN